MWRERPERSTGMHPINVLTYYFLFPIIPSSAKGEEKMIRYGLSKLFRVVGDFISQEDSKKAARNRYRDEIMASLNVVLARANLVMDVTAADDNGSARFFVKHLLDPHREGFGFNLHTECSDYLVSAGYEAALHIEHDYYHEKGGQFFYYGDSAHPETDRTAASCIDDKVCALKQNENDMRYKDDIEKMAGFIISKSLWLLRSGSPRIAIANIA